MDAQRGILNKLSFSEARHLVARTGFGPEWQRIKSIEGKPMHTAVQMIIGQRHSQPPRPPSLSPWSRLLTFRKSERQKRMIMRVGQGEGKALQTWWANHMLKTRAPLVERMTLFWHNVFPSTIEKTLAPSLLYQQNLTIRKHAFGGFRELLHAVAKDPAMLLYLDGYKNRKEDPNENFSRELLELFTVGIGVYQEHDIREAARAFTGWSIDDRSGRFVMQAQKHDPAMKTIMGKKANFNGDQVLDMLLKHPRTAERVAERFWSEFISVSNPDRGTVKRWANSFRASNYNIAKLLETVLTSNEFWDERNRGALIRSPVDLAIGTLRTLPYKLPKNNLAHQLNNMGQALFDQPSVKGWEGGQEWLSTQSLLLRNNLLSNLTRGIMRTENSHFAKMLPTASPDELEAWLLPIPALTDRPEKKGNQRLVRNFVLDPAYQLL